MHLNSLAKGANNRRTVCMVSTLHAYVRSSICNERRECTHSCRSCSESSQASDTKRGTAGRCGDVGDKNVKDVDGECKTNRLPPPVGMMPPHVACVVGTFRFRIRK